jgi:putative flippase GtrA
MTAIVALGGERATLFSRLLAYAGVSVAALLADTGCYLALCWLGAAPAMGGGLGYIVGLALHYVLSVTYVFDAQETGKGHQRLFAEFVASGLAGLALTIGAIAMGTGVLGLSLLPAKMIAVAASFIAVYVMRTSLVFAAR